MQTTKPSLVSKITGSYVQPIEEQSIRVLQNDLRFTIDPVERLTKQSEIKALRSQIDGRKLSNLTSTLGSTAETAAISDAMDTGISFDKAASTAFTAGTGRKLARLASLNVTPSGLSTAIGEEATRQAAKTLVTTGLGGVGVRRRGRKRKRTVSVSTRRKTPKRKYTKRRKRKPGPKRKYTKRRGKKPGRKRKYTKRRGKKPGPKKGSKRRRRR